MIRPNDPPRQQFTYRNSYGEELRLTVDLEHETAVFGSDDFEDTSIEDDRIQNSDLVLADDEFAWVAQVWRSLFGRELEKLPFTWAIEEAIRQYRAQFAGGRTSTGPH